VDVQVVSPEQVLYEGEAKMVVVRTLGGGDIAFPVLLVSSTYFGYGLPSALLIAGLTLVGLIGAYWIQAVFLKGRPMPALPPIAVMALAGILLLRVI